MNETTLCQGPNVLAGMLPLELYYLSSLTVFGFFVFLAFFLYQRAGSRRAGKLAAFSMASIAIYVSASVVTYDIYDPDIHVFMQKVSWLGASFIAALWLHMTVLLRAEEREGRPRTEGLRSLDRMAIWLSYSAASILAVFGTVVPNEWSSWLWNYAEMTSSPWPYCRWIHYWIETGPYFDLFNLYIGLSLGYSVGLLGRMAWRANKQAAALNKEEGALFLSNRNQYVWLIAATILLVSSGFLLAIAVDINLPMPDSVGQLLFLPQGFLVALAIGRHDALVDKKHVARDLYRASASMAVLCISVVAVAYFAQTGDVRKTTLLALVTLTIVFYSNLDRWWRFLDSLFFGPKVAKERADVRSALGDSAGDPDLALVAALFQKWSADTQRVFLLLGEGLNRSTIAKTMSIHISTVDLHIRRIKDAMSTDKLEDIRALATKKLIQVRVTRQETPSPSPEEE